MTVSATHIYCHTNCISHNGDDAHKDYVNNATSYRTISAHSFGNFYNVDNIPDNGNHMISFLRHKKQTMRYKVMHVSIAWIIVVLTRIVTDKKY